MGETIQNIFLFNFNKICRLCLSQNDEVTGIFEQWTSQPSTLPYKIKECISLEVATDDGLPQNLCRLCLSKVNQWFDFKNFCKQSDVTLREHFLNKSITVNLQKPVNSPENYSDSGNYPFDELKINEVNVDIKPDIYNDEEEFSESDEKPLIEFKEEKVKKKSKVKVKDEHYNEAQAARGRAPKAKPVCNICQQKFNRLIDLIEHRSEKHEIKCDLENVSDEKSLERLVMEESLFSIFKCHVCKKEFSERNLLKQHCRLEHDTKIIQPYPCSHCDRQFSAWNLLVIHERKHTGEKPYSCDICGKKNFISQTSLRRHKLIHLKLYNCEVCNKDFNCDSALRAHIRSKHTQEKPYLCNVCGRSFSLSAILAAHLTSHSTERKYKCDICGFASKTSGNHYRHRNTHNAPGVKLFHCERCGKSFDSKIKLSSHLVIHRPVRPHVCNVCGKGFLYNNKLERHVMLVHARQRPFPCEMCGKKLASKFGLNIHLKTHMRNQNLQPKIVMVETLSMNM